MADNSEEQQVMVEVAPQDEDQPRLIYEEACPYPISRFYNAEKPDSDAIGIGICLYQLRNISPKVGTFQARIRVQMKWRCEGISDFLKAKVAKENSPAPAPVVPEPETFDRRPRTLIFNTQEEMYEIMTGYFLTNENPDGSREFKDLLLPQVSTNAIESELEEWYCYLKNWEEEDKDMVTLQYVESGTYAMLDPDASEFPFDIQFADFKFSLWDTGRYSHRYFQTLEYPDGTYYEHMLNADIPLQDYELYKPLITIRREGIDNSACSFVVSPMLRRQATFYYKHIFARLTIVSALSLGVFTVPVDGDGLVTRTAIVLTLLLTVVTFSFTVQQDIPRLRKYSYLDLFVLGHFGLLGLLAGDVFSISFMGKIGAYNTTELQEIDNVVGNLFTAVWVFYNAGVAIAFYIYYWHRSQWKGRVVRKLFKDDAKMVKEGVKYMRALKYPRNDRPLAYIMPHPDNSQR